MTARSRLSAYSLARDSSCSFQVAVITTSQNGSHSASVRHTLCAAGRDVEVAQVTPDRIYLRTSIDLPPCDAMLFISIDGQVTEQRIRLPEGASADSPAVITTR